MANIVMNCDLAVIGAGGSGLVSAVKASDLGVKNILVLETGIKPGGSTWFAGWGASGHTKWRQEAGYPDTRDDSFRQTMKQYNWTRNFKLIRNFYDYEGPFFDWMHELCDVSDFFEKPAPYVAPAEGREGGPMGMMGMGGERKRNIESWYHINKDSRDPSMGPGRGGSYLITRLLEQCEKKGIKILTETRAREFVKDAEGNVTGLCADVKEGKLQVNFRACVVAAGGLTANREKLKKTFPQWFENDNSLHIFCCPGSVGDSFDMAERIGAFVDYSKMSLEFGGPVHHPYSFTIYTLYMLSEAVYINLNGERFLSETDLVWIAQYPTVEQPKGEVYAIYDDAMIEGATEKILQQRQGEEWPFLKDGLRKDIEYEVALDEAGVPGNRAKKANTFEELAEKMGVPPKTFVETMRKYNEYCEKGVDRDMYKKPEYLIPFKKPPYYAFWLQNFANTTHNGIVINENMEMVREDDRRGIPNLFAVGDNAQAMDGGMRWGPVSGYMAGIAAAKYMGVGPGL